MIDEDIIQSIISVVHGSDTPRTSTSRYSVLSRNTLHIGTKLECVQEEEDTLLLESKNQQHIFRCVRNVINLFSVQGQTYI